jgi:DNA-binding MarR family transcriptional regulator
MVEQTPGVTRLLDRLEAKELIRRQRCASDRRQHLCWIAPKGLAILQKIDAVEARTHEHSLKGLRVKDRAALVRMLDAIREAHE